MLIDDAHLLHQASALFTVKVRHVTGFGIEEDQEELVQSLPGIPTNHDTFDIPKPKKDANDDLGGMDEDDKYDSDLMRLKNTVRDRTIAFSRKSMHAMESIFESRKSDYESAMKDFDQSYEKYDAEHSKFDDRYNEMKKAYVDSCKPLEDKYDINPKCAQRFHRGAEEYLARRNWPHFKIGQISTIDVSPSDLKASAMPLTPLVLSWERRNDKEPFI